MPVDIAESQYGDLLVEEAGGSEVVVMDCDDATTVHFGLRYPMSRHAETALRRLHLLGKLNIKMRSSEESAAPHETGRGIILCREEIHARV